MEADAIDRAEELILAALREEEQKRISTWRGCRYCNDPQPYRDCVLPDGTEQFLCSKDGLFGDCYINERRIQFCPMCGRPITRQAKEAYASLAAYEDIGTPEEINRILDAYGRGLTLRSDAGERLELIKDIQTYRLREIMTEEIRRR